MAIQNSGINTTYPFILYQDGNAHIRDNETLLTDGARTVALAQFTIMSYIPAATAALSKWVPWTSDHLAGTTGTQRPRGILMSDTVTAAQLAAGDVTGISILTMGPVTIDASQLVFDAGSTGILALNTLYSIPTVPTNSALNCEDYLNMFGIFCATTRQATIHEN